MLAGDVQGNVHVFDFICPTKSVYDLKLKQLEKALEVDIKVLSNVSVCFLGLTPAN